jgi:hypothetical protein
VGDWRGRRLGVSGREAEEDEANGDGGDGELECGEMEEGNAKRLGGCVFFWFSFRKNKQKELTAS